MPPTTSFQSLQSLSDALQEQARRILQEDLAQSTVDPAACMYSLWPGNECIKIIKLGDSILYEEGDFDPAYDLDWGDGGGPSDEIISIWKRNTEADQRRVERLNP